MFRSASDACDSSKREIAFTDTVIETSPVLRIYLRLLTKMTFPYVDTFSACERLCNTITFLRKYECKGLVQLIETECTNRLLLELMPPLYVFMVGATMDAPSLCSTALSHRYATEPATGEAKFIDSALLSLTPSAAANGGTWPLNILERLPLDYSWAVSAAWTQGWGHAYATACAGREDFDIASHFWHNIQSVKHNIHSVKHNKSTRKRRTSRQPRVT